MSSLVEIWSWKPQSAPFTMSFNQGGKTALPCSVHDLRPGYFRRPIAWRTGEPALLQPTTYRRLHTSSLECEHALSRQTVDHVQGRNPYLEPPKSPRSTSKSSRCETEPSYVLLTTITICELGRQLHMRRTPCPVELASPDTLRFVMC